MNLLEIKDPSFVKNLSKKELNFLAEDIRHFLLENISKTGGHLSSNLGVVELTIAMHYVFSSPEDIFIFDVGHQCYTHKILTGRAKDFTTLRKYNGLSGFINKQESVHDQWESGHSSTSLSAQCGFLLANKDKKVITLIGDSSIANGISFEAMNYMSTIKGQAPIIILNDNKMSISKSVGAVSRSFSKLRSTRTYQAINNFFVRITPHKLRAVFHRIKRSIKGLILKENLFEDWGYDYMGPYDGNDISVCIKTLKAAKNLNKPCVIHFITKKGKGYKFAEEDKDGTYHSVSSFDLNQGVLNKNEITFTSIASNMIEKFIVEKNYFIINPAMIKGTNIENLIQKYPNNIIDVGIEEEHATVMASAIAQQNKKVILMLYSTFAQRAYDYFLNDIARINAHVIICLDHADLVSGDGSTHQGIYDISMFNSMPNFTILSARNGNELEQLFYYADKINSPVVIRYPKNKTNINGNCLTIENVSWEIVQEGNELTILTYGENVDYVLSSIKDLTYSIEVINCRFIRPFDEKILNKVLQSNRPILIYENAIGIGGFTSSIYRYLIENNYKNRVKSMCLNENNIVPVGDIESIRKYFSLSKEDIINNIKELL